VGCATASFGGCQYDLGSVHSVVANGGTAGASTPPTTSMDGGAGGLRGAAGRSPAGGTGAGAGRAGAGGIAASAGSAGVGGVAGAGGVPDASVPGALPAHVISASPGPGATNVDTHAVLALMLDRTAAASDRGAVELLVGGVAVAVTPSVSGNTLTLSPDAPLAMSTTYTVRVNGVLGMSEWSITTADGVFRTTEELFYGGPNASEFSRAVVADTAIRDGLAVVAYRTVQKVLLRRTVGGVDRRGLPDSDAAAPAVSWQAEEPVADAATDTLVAGETTAEVGVGIDGAGGLVVAWNAPISGTTGAYTIFTSTWSSKTKAWSAAERRETDTDSCAPADTTCTVSEPRLAVSSGGAALLTWERWTKPGTAAATSTVWATALVAGKWLPATVISGASARQPSVAVDGPGDGAVVWVEQSGGFDVPRVRRFTAAKQTWDTARTLASTAQTNARVPSVSMNDAATLLASWAAWPPGADVGTGQGMTRVYWEAPTVTGMPGSGPASAVNDIFRASLGAKNDVLGAWGAPNPNSVSAVVHSLPAGGADVWPSGKTISSVEDYVSDPVPRIDARARGLVTWRVGTDKVDPGLYAARYDSTKWSAPRLLVPGSQAGPFLAMEDGGRALVAWIDTKSGALDAILFE